jgi:hypothetical protein
VANAIAQNLGAPMTLSAVAQITDTLELSTGGPLRPGFVQLTVELDYLHADLDGSAAAGITDGVFNYQFSGGGGIHGPVAPVQCNPEDCIYDTTLPFELGSAFQLSTSDLAYGGSKGAYTGADITISLFEAKGTTPVALLPAPEPWMVTLCLLGVSACAFLGFKRTQRRG